MLMACHSIRTSFEKNGCKRTELQSKGDPDTKGMAPDVDARGAEGKGKEAGPLDVVDAVVAGIGSREHASSLLGCHLKTRNKNHSLDAPVDGESTTGRAESVRLDRDEMHVNVLEIGRGTSLW